MNAATDLSDSNEIVIDLAIEIRGIEQGNRPVSVSFPSISVTPRNDGDELVAFEGPYEVASQPGTKRLELEVEAPIFVGLIANVFGRAEGLARSYKGRSVPSMWVLAGFDATLTVATRFFGYKAGSKRSQGHVGLSQLTGKLKGSAVGGVFVGHNHHFWNPPNFALTFEEARFAFRSAGYGRFSVAADYSWNGGEWTAKTKGLLVLDGNPLAGDDEGELRTVLNVALDEQVTDNADGLLAGSVRGEIFQSR
jgi:hypothetical protein